jgi:adenine deaminase
MAIGPETLARRIDQALGRTAADLVVKDARLLNLVTGELDAGDIAVAGDTIVGIHDTYRGRVEIDGRGAVVVPGFIDSHVHVEGSLLTPAGFEEAVLPRGTTTAICDPHEIANVLGADGIRYVLDAAEPLRLDLRVQLSSCVPSTALETSGARLEAADLTALRGRAQALGLAEVMNVPGVLAKDVGLLAKLAAFQDAPIDGHAPLVGGRDLNAVIACGVRSCHESTSLPEAREKLRKGMHALIREGSVARNLAALAPLITETTAPFTALCTDDRNPLDIAEEGHIDHLVRRAIALGAPVTAVYRAASWSAAQLYGLTDRGLVAPGRRADLLLLDDLETCAVRTVIKDGRPLGEAPATAVAPPAGALRSVRLAPVTPELFTAPVPQPTAVIGVAEGTLLTERLDLAPPARGADPARDVLMLAVLERHGVNGNVARGYVHGFGLPRGALAGSVGHDSHNVIVVGADAADMAAAVNRLTELQGGFVAMLDGEVVAELALPLAGLISLEPLPEVVARLRHLRDATRGLGCRLADPFQTLAFLPLPVIPHLRLTDRGLVDVDRFALLAA